MGGAVALLVMVASKSEGRAFEPVHLRTVLVFGAEFQIIPGQASPLPAVSSTARAIGNPIDVQITPVNERSASRPATALPAQALLTEIATWLSANFELPVMREYPRVEFVSTMKLAALRYQNLLPDRTDEIGVNEPPMQASQLPDIVGAYHDKTKTIYLADTWTGTTVAELSILVHEMVHHMQNLAELKYECAGAREKPAYIAQEEWLKRYGLDLERAFEIDKFTLFIKSSCMF